MDTFKTWNALICKYIRSFIILLMMITTCYSGGNCLAAERDYLIKNGYLEVVYDNNNGLGSAAANTVVQTEDGFVWIGTYNGLIRYDGADFYHYPNSCGINSVSELFVDSKNRLWIGTNDNGVACYEGGKFTFFNKEKGLGANIVRRVAENDEGTIFVGTTKGLYMIRDNKVQPLNDPRISNLYIRSLCRAFNNKVVGTTVKGDFFVIAGDKLETYISRHAFVTGHLECVRPDRFEGDVYWVGTTGSAVMKLRIHDNEYATEETLLATGMMNINDIYHYNGQIIVSSDEGTGIFDEDKKFHHFTSLKTKSSVDRIMVDYEDNIWLASSRSGVAKLTKTRFREIFSEAGIDKKVVNSITKYDEKLYVATDSGLLALQYDKPVSDKLTQMLNKTRVRHTLVDSSNNLWVSTYANTGLVKYNGQSGQVTIFNERKGLPNNRVRVALEGKDGNIYVGTRYGMAIIRNDKVVKVLTTKDGLPNPQVLCLLENEGKIYAGTDGGGICVIHNGVIEKVYGEAEGLTSGVILRMAKDIDSKRIWISTNSSIAYLENDKLEIIKNFPSTNNFDFIFTPYGEMLITCGNGIYVTTSKKMRDTGSFVQLLSRRDGLADSLTANSFNYIDSDDNLYLCMQSGITALNLHNLTEVGSNLKLKVLGINIDGKDLYFDASRKLTIPSDVTRLTFKGYILSNSLNNATLYSWLEGFDKEPDIYSRFNNKEKTYTNLPGGRYTLHVGIYDSKTDSVIKEQIYYIEKELKLSEHTYFWIGLLLLVLGFGFLPYSWYNNRRFKAMDAKQKETEAFLDQVINSFATAIDLKDHYTQGHSMRVAGYSRQLALALGWTKEAADNIYRIGMLHDVGKVIIPSEILNKKGPLNDAEYDTMKTHTDIGAEILNKITSFPAIAVGANTHHERFDGRGYGHKLAGKDIPIEGRIIAVADCFDAMNSTRVYRPNLTRERILEQLKLARNTQLDGEIVDVLLSLIDKGEIVIEGSKSNN